MRKNIIAVCISHMDDILQTRILRNIIKTAEEFRFQLQIFNSFDELSNESLHVIGEKSIFDLIKYDNLCGIIIFSEKMKDVEVIGKIVSKGRKLGIPVVSIDSQLEGCYNLKFDYADSFEMMVRHVVEVHNCRDIYLMAGTKDNRFSDDRLNAARKVLKEYGIEPDDDHIGYGDFWSVPTEKAMDEFFEKNLPLPEAFIAANDSMALAICDKLAEKGYYVPDDTIVTGFDGIEIGKYNIPRLTTVEQDYVEAGRQAVMLIRDVLRHQIVSDTIEIPFRLDISQSCGCRDFSADYTNRVKELYYEITDLQQFATCMDKMAEIMTENCSIQNIYDKLDCFSDKTDEFLSFYICMKLDKIKVDDEFGTKINILPGHENDDMLLFAIHDYENYMYKPLNTFSSKEILPSLDYVMDRYRNMIFLPMHIQDEVFGYMAFGVTSEVKDYYKLSQFVTRFTQGLSNVVSHCKIEKAYSELEAAKKWIEELYVIDPLTGTLNRRGFYKEFGKKTKDAQYSQAIVISVDLDGLKLINDTYGHKEGDYAIKTISEALEKCAGNNGLVSRFGGDEFVVVLFTNIGVNVSATKFIYAVNNYLQMRDGISDKPYHIRASFGSTTFKLPFEGNFDELISAADTAMYDMKKKHHEQIIK